ncbi:MAG TPA: ABC transporter permease [Micropepsaceae bacterium]|nr:ABC transporter permease [Micropepsaceae bacterium]
MSLIDAGTGRRIGAVILRHWYLIAGSWPRFLDLCYWPIVQMILWGFIQTFLVQQSNFFAQAGGVLLGGVMLWDVLFRGQIGIAISFFEEVYSRNLGHLLATPLRIGEYIAALMIVSLIRTMAGLFPATLLAIWFFGFSLYSLGIALVAFFFSLIAFGWSIGLFVAGLVLRYGLGAESFAWAFIFALAPLCGVYYPTSILPGWVQVLSAALPASYIFNGMRAVLIDHVVRLDYLLAAAGLNLVWLAGGVVAFLIFHAQARDRGMLLQLGE